MGTKIKPGKFDCYADAHPDEPFFTLLARDPLAAPLVALWARVRCGDRGGAQVVFASMLSANIERYRADPDLEKVEEAVQCSDEMAAWRKANR